MTGLRRGDQLAEVDEPAWPALAQAFALREQTQVLPVSREQGLSVLYRLQVTARSALGAVALNSGGVLLDSGWLRLLGGGSPGLPDLASANGLVEPGAGSRPPARLVVGFDVLGGQFAVDGGGSAGGSAGEVCYFAPDSLAWQPLGFGFGDFSAWSSTGDTAGFYTELRWPGWEAEVSSLSLSQGISCYPPLRSAEGKDVAACSRRAIDFDELLAFHEEMARQLAGIPNGGQIELAVGDEPRR